MDDLTDIREMYNSAWDAESTRLQRHEAVGFRTLRIAGVEPAISADDGDARRRLRWCGAPKQA